MKKNKLIAILFLTVFSYVSAAELPHEMYLEIVQNADDPHAAAQLFLKLRSSSKAIKEKLDKHTEAIIEKIAQKLNVDPSIPAFYIGTDTAMKYYNERIKDQKIKLADNFDKYLSDVLEQVLVRYDGSKAFKELVNNLLKNGAYIVGKHGVNIRGDKWLVNWDNLVAPSKWGDKNDSLLDFVDKEFNRTFGYSPNFLPFLQRFNKTIELLVYVGGGHRGKIEVAIYKLNLDLNRIGETLFFNIIGGKGREYIVQSFYPQVKGNGYVIVAYSFVGSYHDPKDKRLELFFVNQEESKKIMEKSFEDKFIKIVQTPEDYKKAGIDPEKPLF